MTVRHSIRVLTKVITRLPDKKSRSNSCSPTMIRARLAWSRAMIEEDGRLYQVETR